MPECIFCKIVNGQVPSYKVYEDADFLAFLDINPLNPGHTLVIPKRHYKWVWDLPNIGQYFKVVDRLADALKRAFNTEWVVAMVIGEEIPHAHVWLVPRLPDDGHGGAINFALRKKYGDEEMKKTAEKIVHALR